jgi:HAE1 family hydrophobic/amphiphilic exporter-1
MVFPLLGFSINTLSLFGLVLAIGLVVDDAIVVVEAVEQHIEQGLSPRDAALKAMDEVSGPVVAIALIMAVVFIPTAFIPGITGRMYQQFTVTIAVSVLISAFNALTLSPALSALLLRPKREMRGPLGWFFRAFNRAFERVMGGYLHGSHFLMRKAAFALLLLLAVGAVSGLLGIRLPGGLFPRRTRATSMRTSSFPWPRRSSAPPRSTTSSTRSSRRSRASSTTRAWRASAC